MSIACAAVLFAACSSTRNDAVENGRIAYDIAVSPLVKSSSPKAGSIEPAVWAVDAAGGDFYLEDEPLVQGDDMLWTPECGAKWPDFGLKQYFCSPKGRAGFSPEGGICFADYSLDEACELYYTEQVDAAGEQGVAAVVMRNALCAVRLYACSTMPSYAKFMVRSVEFRNVCTAGSFNSLPGAEWTLDEDSVKDVMCFDSKFTAGEYPALVADRTMMIPQDGTVEVSVVCDVDADGIVLDNQKYDCKVKVNWKPGKVYDYVIRADGESDMKVSVEYFKDNGSGL